MSLFSDLFTGQRRRHDERDVRVNRDAGQVPAPTSHRAPARNAAAALRQIRANDPATPAPSQKREAARDGLEYLARYREFLLDRAADWEWQANDLLGLAARDRAAADTLGALFALHADAAPVPLDGGRQEPGVSPAVAGDLCFGCKRSRDTLPCYSALEGRDVPLCARCHPSADIVPERDHDADGEEPERVETPDSVLHLAGTNLLPICGARGAVGAGVTSTLGAEVVTCPGCLEHLRALEDAEAHRDEDMAHADAVWHAQHPGQCCPNFMTCVECSTFQRVPGPAPDLPEALVSEPLGAPSVRSEADAAGWADAPVPGPAAAPQLHQQRDTQTITLPWGAPAVLDDTLTDLERVDGAQ